jgi:hypothetical protein
MGHYVIKPKIINVEWKNEIYNFAFECESHILKTNMYKGFLVFWKL